MVGVVDEDISRLLAIGCWLLADKLSIRENNGTCAIGDTTINERMSIYCCAYLGYKQVALTYLAAVEMQTFDLNVRATDYLYRLNRV